MLARMCPCMRAHACRHPCLSVCLSICLIDSIYVCNKEIHRLSYIHTYTHSHTHAHTDTDPPRSIPLLCYNFWTLADFQDSSANRAKLCFVLLRHSPRQCIGVRHFLETRRLPGVRCQSSLALFYLLGPA